VDEGAGVSCGTSVDSGVAFGVGTGVLGTGVLGTGVLGTDVLGTESTVISVDVGTSAGAGVSTGIVPTVTSVGIIL